VALDSAIGLSDRSNIPLVVGGGGSSYNARYAGTRIHIPVGVPAAKRTVKEILFPINGEGTSVVGGRTDATKQANGTWYGNGDGGTAVAQLCTPQADGDPDLTNVLGSETFAFAARWNLMATRWGSSSFRQVLMASLNNTVVMAEGGTYWLIISITTPTSNSNYFSLNFSDMRGAPNDLAPNQFNSYSTPNATGAVAGLDSLSAMAQTLDASEPRTWVYSGDNRNGNQIAWCATTWTSNSATPFYGFAPWTGGNQLTGQTMTTPTVPAAAVGVPITGVRTASAGSPGTITVRMFSGATQVGVATATVTQSGFRSASLTPSLTPTSTANYFKITVSGIVYSSALEGGMVGPYGSPSHSPLGYDFAFTTTGGYSTYTLLGVDLNPWPWFAGWNTGGPPPGGDTTAPAVPAAPGLTALNAAIRVAIVTPNTETDLAGYLIEISPDAGVNYYGAHQFTTDTFPQTITEYNISGTTVAIVNGTAYRVRLKAFDDASPTANVSGPGAYATSTPTAGADTTPPATAATPTVVADVLSFRVENASPNVDSDLAGYQIEVKDHPAGTAAYQVSAAGTSTGFFPRTLANYVLAGTVTAFTAGSAYDFRLRAYDTSGNVGTAGGSAVGTALAANPPPANSTYDTLIAAFTTDVYWKATEGGGTTVADSSGNSRTGTVIGGASWGTADLLAGAPGGHLDLTGSSNYVLGGTSHSRYNGTAVFSAGGVFKPDVSLASGRLWSRSDGSAGWETYAAGGTMKFGRQAGGTLYEVTGPVLQANLPYSYIGRYDGSSVYLNVNGTAYGPAASGGSIVPAAGVGVTLGAKSAGGGTVVLQDVVTGLTGAQMYTPYNDASGTVADDKIGSNDGTATAGVAFNAAALFPGGGSCATFSGGSFNYGDKFDFAGTAAFTLMAAFKPTTIDTVSRRVISKEDGTNGYMLWFNDASGLKFSRIVAGGYSNITGPTPTLNSTYLAVVRYTGAALIMDVLNNGTATNYGTVTTASSLTDNAFNFTAGAKASGGGGGFAGVIGHVYAGTVSISDAQVASVFTAAQASSGAGTVGGSYLNAKLSRHWTAGTVLTDTQVSDIQLAAFNAGTSIGGTTVDATAPAVPTGLNIGGGTLGTVANSTQAPIGWARNTENDLAGYGVLRATGTASGAPFGTVANLTKVQAHQVAGTATYSDTTVAAGGTYVYGVQAYDAAGTPNYSAISPTITVVVPGTATGGGTGGGTAFTTSPGFYRGYDRPRNTYSVRQRST